MPDDLDIYRINQTRKTPEITILPPFMAINRKRKKQEDRKKEEKRRLAFKRRFFERFNLNEEKFSINLIKRNDRWFIEIYNKKTGKKIYQDYSTVCNILDIGCKLPKIVGVNIDKKV
jgi:thymidylate kinase